MRRESWLICAGLVAAVGAGVIAFKQQERAQEAAKAQIEGLEQKLRQLETAVAAAQAPATPRAARADNSTPSKPAMPVLAVEDAQRFKEAVRQAQAELKLEAQLDFVLSRWNWEAYISQAGLDKAQSAALEPIFQQCAGQLRVLRSSLTSDTQSLAQMEKRSQELSLAFYDQAKPGLKGSQLFPTKRFLGWNLDEKEYMLLKTWDWELLVMGYKLGESVRPYFEDALHQLHDANDQSRDRADHVALLQQKERETRGALLKKIEPHVSANQLARLKGHFGSLDSLN